MESGALLFKGDWVARREIELLEYDRRGEPIGREGLV